MPVVINGSTGISGTDGSASTPAVQGTDTNTGLFFPAADTIAFAEGGTEVMRIDSAGRVGIGDIPGYRLDVAFAGDNGARIRSSTLGSYLVFENVTGAVVANSSNTPLVFTTNNVERMRIDASGNVGIGTSAPTQRLSVDGNATFTGTAVMASSFLRNRLINGAMEIAQRGTSGTSGYLLDRWLALNTSAQSQSSDAPTGFINSVEFTSSSATFPFVAQRIERANSYDLAGRTVTLSFWAKSLSGSAILYVEAYRANANDNFSSVTLEAVLTVSASPSTSWTFYSVSFPLSASATTGLEIRIIRNNASAASTRVTGVQLEVGSVATPFERRQFGQELALCQRYCYVLRGQGGFTPFATGTFITSSQAYCFVPFPVTMRAGPSVTFSAAATFYIDAGTITSVVSDQTGPFSAFVVVNMTGGASGGVFTRLLANNNNTAFIAYAAEL